MTSKDERDHVSARVKVETKKILETWAKKADISLALLVANVLDDYAAWLEGKTKD